MITPTIGRMLHYIVPQGVNDGLNGDGLYAAVVAHVHDPVTVNLTVFDSNGHSVGRSDVELIQDGEPGPVDNPFCKWMPYQIGQAKKTEELQEQMEEGSRPA